MMDSDTWDVTGITSSVALGEVSVTASGRDKVLVSYSYHGQLGNLDDITHDLYQVAKKTDHQLVVTKPTTYMNLSGKAISYWLGKEKLEIDKKEYINPTTVKVRLIRAGKNLGMNIKTRRVENVVLFWKG